jgi:mono/diheme cytochrome c family protein/cytochrome c551/c552
MTTILKTVGFSATLIGSFTAVTYLLPQMVEEAPVEEVMDLETMTMETFIVVGEKLYDGKGTCSLCHNALGRAPDLIVKNAVQIAAERLSDPQYQGRAADSESYLRESMLDPNIYVVSGFGKKGTQDSESPMPAVNKAPIELSDTEVDAIIAFLQAKDGNPVTVTLPVNTLSAEPASNSNSAPEASVANDPLEALDKFACKACHSILESESPIGPSLNDVGARLTTVEIRESIISPNAVIAEGYAPMMPDQSESMTVKELEMLVEFLSGQAG